MLAGEFNIHVHVYVRCFLCILLSYLQVALESSMLTNRSKAIAIDQVRLYA